MKNILLFILPFLLLSCNHKEQKEKEKRLQDSILNVENLKVQEEKEIELQNQKLLIEAQSKVAWGDAHFGMSVKEVKETNAFKESHSYVGNPYQRVSINPYESRIKQYINIEASFFKDRLFRIDIESNERTANYFDTRIKDLTFLLKNMIEKKYGKATKSNDFPSLNDMKPDRYISVSRWEIVYVFNLKFTTASIVNLFLKYSFSDIFLFKALLIL